MCNIFHCERGNELGPRKARPGLVDRALLVLALLPGVNACVGSSEPALELAAASGTQPVAGEPKRHDDRNRATEADPSDEPSPPATTFQLPIDLEADFGAFLLTFQDAEVTVEGSGGRTTVRIPFDAFNRSTSTARPLAGVGRDDAFLEVAGEHHAGSVDARDVPGRKHGSGTIAWSFRDELATPEALRAAVATLGDAGSNQLVIDLADPSAHHTLTARWLDGFELQYRSTTFAFEELQIHYNNYNDNRPLRAGTALLVLVGRASTSTDESNGFYLYWEEADFFLTLPNRESRATDSYVGSVSRGDSKDIEISFDIERPIAGRYVFGVSPAGEEEVTHEIMIDE